MWQTEHVAARLAERHPGLAVEIVGMTTKGDRILDRPLAQVGGKGLFITELEVALATGEADIAVSPADGRIIDLKSATDPISGEERPRVSIFMHVGNVHVNRAPIEG